MARCWWWRSFAGSGVGLVEVYDPVTGAWTGSAAGIDKTFVCAPPRCSRTDDCWSREEQLMAWSRRPSRFYLIHHPAFPPPRGPQISSLSAVFQTDKWIHRQWFGFLDHAAKRQRTRRRHRAEFLPWFNYAAVNGDTRFVPATNWSATSFNSGPVTSFPPGGLGHSLRQRHSQRVGVSGETTFAPPSLTLNNLSRSSTRLHDSLPPRRFHPGARCICSTERTRRSRTSAPTPWWAV